ncbi:MAG: phytoene desaturase family protein, partial [Rhodohalobacter sp.]
MNQQAIIIGAGLGGLAASALLASQGYSVTVFEKNSTHGGKMQELNVGDFRFDTGPSLFTMPFILKKLFKECGEELRDYLEFNELEPVCRYFFKDETVFDNYSDRKRSKQQIEQFAPEDAESYSEFLNYTAKLYEQTADAFLFNPLYTLGDLKGLKLTDFLGIDAFSTVSDVVDEHFQSDYLKKFFKRFTTYNGSSPYQAPGTLNVIPHVELNQGGYYVKGGMYRISEALYELSEKMGVTFHFDTEVERISIRNKRAVSIKVNGGEKFYADLIVANSDATDTILNLMDEQAVSNSKRKRQKAIEPSCSGFVMLLGVNKQWEQLKHHNIFFSDDYEKEFRHIFKEKVLPDDPTIYLANTSYTDPEHAPENSSNLFILVNSPYVTEEQNWSELRETYSSFLINELENRGLKGLKDSIVVKKVITPSDFLNHYGSNRGSIYGTSSNSKFAAFLRPRNKIRGISNLYLVGGST